MRSALHAIKAENVSFPPLENHTESVKIHGIDTCKAKQWSQQKTHFTGFSFHFPLLCSGYYIYKKYQSLGKCKTFGILYAHILDVQVFLSTVKMHLLWTIYNMTVKCLASCSTKTCKVEKFSKLYNADLLRLGGCLVPNSGDCMLKDCRLIGLHYIIVVYNLHNGYSYT